MHHPAWDGIVVETFDAREDVRSMVRFFGGPTASALCALPNAIRVGRHAARFLDLGTFENHLATERVLGGARLRAADGALQTRGRGSIRRMRAAFLAPAAGLSVLLGCGASSSSPAAAGTPTASSAAPPTAVASTAPAAEPAGPSDEDAAPCTADTECLLGTPRGCCAAWCPEDSRAWTRVAWAAYQAECAVQECSGLEEPSCAPTPPAPDTVRCIAARCVRVPATAPR